MHPLHTLFTIAVSKPTNNLRTTCPASAQAGVSQASLGVPPWGTPRRRARRLLRSRAWLPPARSSWGTRNPSTRAARRRCAAAAQAAPAERLRGGGALSPANSRQGALALTPARVAVAAGCDPAPVCVWRPHRQTMEPQGALAPAHRARTATTTWARARACACVRAHTLLSSRYCPQSLFGIAVEQAPIYIYTSAVRGAQGRGGGARKRGSNAQARLRITLPLWAPAADALELEGPAWDCWATPAGLRGVRKGGGVRPPPGGVWLWRLDVAAGAPWFWPSDESFPSDASCPTSAGALAGPRPARTQKRCLQLRPITRLQVGAVRHVSCD